MNLDCLKCEKLILGGDLNFSIGFSKVWGNRARMDPLSNLFSKTMENFGLVDIIPSVMHPTWINRRIGTENISKRLDRFLLSADMLDFDYF